MATSSPKVPIPLPVQGVLAGINPRLIGPTGLVKSKNWIFRDGSFQSRDGLLPLGMDGVGPAEGVCNLVATDNLAEPNETFPFSEFERDTEAVDWWVWTYGVGGKTERTHTLAYNDVFLTEQAATAIESSNNQKHSPFYYLRRYTSQSPTELDERWTMFNYGMTIDFITGNWLAPKFSYSTDDGGPLYDSDPLGPYEANFTIEMQAWQVGDPDFLGEAGDNFLRGTFESADVSDAALFAPFCELPEQHLGEEYEIRLKIASDADAKWVKAVPVSFKYDGTTDIMSPSLYPPPDPPSNPPPGGGTVTGSTDPTPDPRLPGWTGAPAEGYEEELNWVRHNYGDLTFHDSLLDTIAEPDWSDDNEFVIVVDMADYDEHTHLGLFLIFEAEEDATIAFGQYQVAWGDTNAYRLPSAEPTAPGVGKVSVYQRPMGITQYDRTQAQIFTVMGTKKGWWKNNVSDQTWIDITDPEDQLNGTDVSQVVFRTFEDDNGNKVLLGTNGKETVKYWDGASETYSEVVNEYDGTDAGDDPDWEDSTMIAKAMAVTFNRIMWGNINTTCDATYDLPDGIITSEALYYDRWHDGSVVRLADTPGPITSLMEMGNQLTAIYKTDAIYVAQAQGGAIPFSYQLKSAQISGPASPLAVVQVDEGLHIYLSQDGDLVLFDGVRPRSLTPTAHNYLQTVLDFKSIGQCFGMYNRALKELYFIYPPQGSEGETEAQSGIMISMQNPSQPTIWPLAWAFPITAGTFSYINQSKLFKEETRWWEEVDVTWDSFTRYTPNMLFCSASTDNVGMPGTPEGVAFNQRGDKDWHGPMSLNFETGISDFDDLTRFKTVKEIDHLFNPIPGQEVQILLRKYDYSTSNYISDVDTIDLTEGPYISSHRLSGRMFALGIKADVSHRLEWGGSEASIHMRGLR